MFSTVLYRAGVMDSSFGGSKFILTEQREEETLFLPTLEEDRIRRDMITSYNILGGKMMSKAD